MNKTLEKNLINKTNLQSESKLTINDIKKFYKSNSKNKIGLEYERLCLDRKTLNCASYDKVSKTVETFAKNNNWELIFDNNTIIGAISNEGTSISLEPGCQLEISLSAKKNIIDIDFSLNKIITSLDLIAKKYDILFLGYGVNPKDNVDKIPLLNKQRYLIMNEYLPKAPNSQFVKYMMRKTAGIQINIDYKNEMDAYYKLKFFNLIMPFIQGLCSNSPFEDDTLYDKKSLRANIWRHTGANRCNFFYKNAFKNTFLNKNIFEKYIAEIIKVPMLYIVRENQNIAINGKITFEEFLKKGYKNHSAKYEDYILHQSLCFPDVRLKNYIEIRNHDSAEPRIALALCAFYKGLEDEDFKKLLDEFDFLKFDEIEQYNINSINYGINWKVNKSTSAIDVLTKIFNISISNLGSFDRLYLKPLLDMIKSKKTNSDLIIEYNIKNTKELVDFLIS